MTDKIGIYVVAGAIVIIVGFMGYSLFTKSSEKMSIPEAVQGSQPTPAQNKSQQARGKNTAVHKPEIVVESDIKTKSLPWTAVINFTVDSSVEVNMTGSAVAVKLEQALADKLRLVTRSQIDKALDELRFQTSDLIDQSKAKKIGKQLGAKYLITGSVVQLGKEITIACQRIDVETGIITRTAEVSSSNVGDFNYTIRQAAEILMMSDSEKNSFINEKYNYPRLLNAGKQAFSSGDYTASAKYFQKAKDAKPTEEAEKLLKLASEKVTDQRISILHAAIKYNDVMAFANKLYSESRKLKKNDLAARKKCFDAIKTLADFAASNQFQYLTGNSKERLNGLKNVLETYLQSIWNGPINDRSWSIPGIGMKFEYVAPGSFQMGSAFGDPDEKPAHQVTLPTGYWIGKYEVKQSEYQAIMGINPSSSKGKYLPVDQVSWVDFVKFCRKLTERERMAGRLPPGYEYRLPTEAEWEYAARGGKKSQGYKYSGSNSIDRVAWYSSNSSNKAHEVGSKSPNELGLYDMSGNVWERCMDKCSYNSGIVTNTYKNGIINPLSKTGTNQISRGGSWFVVSRFCRVANRSMNSPVDAGNGLGGRVVLALIIK